MFSLMWASGGKSVVSFFSCCHIFFNWIRIIFMNLLALQHLTGKLHFVVFIVFVFCSSNNIPGKLIKIWGFKQCLYSVNFELYFTLVYFFWLYILQWFKFLHVYFYFIICCPIKWLYTNALAACVKIQLFHIILFLWERKVPNLAPLVWKVLVSTWTCMWLLSQGWSNIITVLPVTTLCPNLATSHVMLERGLACPLTW